MDTIKILKELNFTEYEAKAYLALLEKSPLSGYAISLSSGVPRSKIYEVLAGLVERGEVMMSHENTALYSPVPPKELINMKKQRAKISFEMAEKALENYSYLSLNRENIWNISGRDAIMSRVKEVIKSAKERILIEIWREDAEEIEEELRQAANSGVEVLVVSYGEITFDFGQIYPHDASEEITEEYGGRWIILSVDDHEVVAGIVSLGDDSRAAWTMHPSLVMPITEVIVHDLYIHEMLVAHRETLEASFGPNLVDLRKRFNFGPSGYSFAAKLGLVNKG
ncbi:TrmB family transcriptional regulator [Sporosarcina sp. HYO08]|uniref:TrmB family transcriptional regulator n=1 Tax=Sporosarcina sp. HYO08 TaxID=1759557 RepID=UPI0007962967|nr:TrmB family transcriptional regulator [Sporosarcina sp. HYO08]KXH80643.1 hypothetical protein AU377_07815 [Sporosarcina sp. HYO08]